MASCSGVVRSLPSVAVRWWSPAPRPGLGVVCGDVMSDHFRLTVVLVFADPRFALVSLGTGRPAAALSACPHTTPWPWRGEQFGVQRRRGVSDAPAEDEERELRRAVFGRLLPRGGESAPMSQNERYLMPEAGLEPERARRASDVAGSLPQAGCRRQDSNLRHADYDFAGPPWENSLVPRGFH